MKLGRKIILVASLALLAGGVWLACDFRPQPDSPNAWERYQLLVDSFRGLTIAPFSLSNASLPEAVDGLNRGIQSRSKNLPWFRIWCEGDRLPAGMRRRLPGASHSAPAVQISALELFLAGGSPAVGKPEFLTINFDDVAVDFLALFIADYFGHKLVADENSIVLYPADRLEYDVIERRYYFVISRREASAWLGIPESARGREFDLKPRLTAQGWFFPSDGVAYYDPGDNKVVFRTTPQETEWITPASDPRLIMVSSRAIRWAWRVRTWWSEVETSLGLAPSSDSVMSQ